MNISFIHKLYGNYLWIVDISDDSAVHDILSMMFFKQNCYNLCELEVYKITNILMIKTVTKIIKLKQCCLSLCDGHLQYRLTCKFYCSLYAVCDLVLNVFSKVCPDNFLDKRLKKNKCCNLEKVWWNVSSFQTCIKHSNLL